MELLTQRRCIIGEGPVWNEFDKKLYFTNSLANEICAYSLDNKEFTVMPQKENIAAMAFGKDGRMLVSRRDGVFYLDSRGVATEKFQMLYGNDAKVGPDGRFYVGTQSRKRLGISDAVDGKLYSIDKDGAVKCLLDGLLLSNGMDWSLDETKFYHTDSDTKIIKEYDFDKDTGEIAFTGRQVFVPGVAGFTVNQENQLLVACWGKGHIAVVDTGEMAVVAYVDLPANVPASCGFAGENMDILAITTASYKRDLALDKNAGFTILKNMKTGGRKPHLFG